MATNSLDAVLAQYEQSKQGSSSSTSKFTQEERMKMTNINKIIVKLEKQFLKLIIIKVDFLQVY